MPPSKVSRREDQAEDRDADHAEEDGRAQRLTPLGGSAGRDSRAAAMGVRAGRAQAPAPAQRAVR